MKILLVNDFGSNIGGAETHVFSLMDTLLAKGHEVKLFAGNSATNLKRVNYATINYRIPLIPNIINPLYYFNFFALRHLRKVLKEYQPDIVHFHNVLYQLSPSVFFCDNNIPKVLTVHDYALVCPRVNKVNRQGKICGEVFSSLCFKSKCISKKSNILRYVSEYMRHLIIDRGVNKLGCMIFPSKYMARQIMLYYHNKYSVVPHYVERKKYRSNNSDKKIVLFVGRLDKLKGLDVLIEAFSKVVKVVPDAKLWVVGNGDHYKSLLKTTQNMRLSNSVTFWGHRKSVDSFYKQASVVVVPSILPEPFGLVVIEAMSYSVPVIASQTGGIMEIIEDNYNGILVKPNDPYELSKKIVKVLQMSADNRRLSHNALKSSIKYSPNRYAKDLEKIYCELL